MPGVRPQDPDPAALIARLATVLADPSLPLSHRFRALFGLKHHACAQPPTLTSAPAIAAIASALAAPAAVAGALLKHEVAYCLGQTRSPLAMGPLREALLRRDAEDPMVRHEAAEALGAIADPDCLGLLLERRDDAAEETIVRETCEIAVERIRWEEGQRREGDEKLKKR